MSSSPTQIQPDRLNHVRTADEVLVFLAEELDWPITGDDLEDASFPFDPDELGIPAERVPRLKSINQLRPLTTGQPWGIFFLEFEGPRLPITPLRQLLRALVTRKRKGAAGDRRTWDLSDLLFVITTTDRSGVELHLVAFETADDQSVHIFSLPWRPAQSPPQHLRRLAEELLPHLAWPDDPHNAEAWRGEWHSAFALQPGAAIRNAKALAERMAAVAHDVRLRVEAVMRAPTDDEPLLALYDEVREQLVADLDVGRFADICAQTLVYGLLSSRVADPIGFGASPVLAVVPLANPFLDAFFERIHDRLYDAEDDDGLATLIADLRATDVEAIVDQFGSTARGADPVIHFYEEFLKAYDPALRAEAGAFYTPQPVVQYMVRSVDEVLRTRLHLRGGLADTSTWAEVAERLGIEIPRYAEPSEPFLRVLDPATGTGTFLVEWMRQAQASFLNGGGDPGGWPQHLADAVLPSMTAFELMPGPYAIAHLKVAMEAHAEGVSEGNPTILLTDSLEHPVGAGSQVALDPLQDPVAFEGAIADAIKSEPMFSVLIGNPPYRRLTRDEAGGWVVHGSLDGGEALFDDVLAAANAHTIFSHVASLYNLYSYFWRWALWTAFERRPGAPAVVSFITGSSWLHGPAFVGLRDLALKLADEIWITDLGGDAHGGVSEENVFDIQTPVSIVTLVRGGGTEGDGAVVRYQRVFGSAEEKLSTLGSVTDPLSRGDWIELHPEAPDLTLLPRAEGSDWDTWPSLADLFPWQQPGAMLNRTWPVAPDPGTLERRWRAFLADDDPAVRSHLFPDPNTGRTITTQVGSLERLCDLPPGAPHAPIVRYLWRALDVQYSFHDPRVAKTESPSLWQSLGPSQVFLITNFGELRGRGPQGMVSTAVPDKHAFCGRGGKDVIPLFRDAAAQDPNITKGLTRAVGERLGLPEPKPADLMAYTICLLGNPALAERWLGTHKHQPLRVPFTADPGVFQRAVETGRELIWLHTFAERMGEGRPATAVAIPRPGGLEWTQALLTIPDDPKSISYDGDAEVVRIGDARLAGVRQAVWDYEFDGWPVLRRWLEHRTQKGRGKRTSELNDIRPDRWDPAWTVELLDLIGVLDRLIQLQPELDDILDAVLTGPRIDGADLPTPSPEERKAPETLTARSPADTLF